MRKEVNNVSCAKRKQRFHKMKLIGVIYAKFSRIYHRLCPRCLSISKIYVVSPLKMHRILRNPRHLSFLHIAGHHVSPPHNQMILIRKFPADLFSTYSFLELVRALQVLKTRLHNSVSVGMPRIFSLLAQLIISDAASSDSILLTSFLL